MTAKIPFLVYRDQLLPASESFIPRQYCGFSTLQPIFVGTKRRADGEGFLPSKPLILGGESWSERLATAAFKQLGTQPPYFADLVAAQPHLIHAQFGRGGAIALPLARRLGIPMVVTFHGGDATKEKHYQRIPMGRFGFAGIYLRRLPALIHYASKIHCVSEFIRQTLIGRGFPPQKLVTMPLGIIIPDAQPPPLPSDQPYIFAAGRLVEKKGFFTLLSALAKLPSRVKLVIAGDGYLKSALQNHAQALGIGARVTWAGWQNKAEMGRWLAGAELIAVPSETSKNGDAEGLPSFLLEAMAMARPVVGTRHAGIPEAIQHENNGLLVGEKDPDALANALKFMLDHPAMAAEFGRAARATVAADFNAINQSMKFEKLLLDCIHGSN